MLERDLKFVFHGRSQLWTAGFVIDGEGVALTRARRLARHTGEAPVRGAVTAFNGFGEEFFGPRLGDALGLLEDLL